MKLNLNYVLMFDLIIPRPTELATSVIEEVIPLRS